MSTNSVMSTWIWAPLLFYGSLISCTTASTGDRSRLYSECLIICQKSNCSNGRVTGDVFKRELPTSSLLWSCDENCRYDCMWDTVEYFTDHGLSVPQFHGKWPFIRFLGIQEPASTLFSVLNFYMHLIMYWKFKKRVRSTYPMYYVWTFFSIVCLNAWVWSTIFHARDKPFTEVMDYCCAFTMVLSLLYCMLLRIAYKNNILYVVITCGYLSALCTHVMYLWSGQINYDYNMKFNIVIGLMTFLISISWSYYNWKRLPHVRSIALFIILTVTVTLLEIADFPPIFWVFDAHSLWHASTAPLTTLLYRFMIADSIYLQTRYDKYI